MKLAEFEYIEITADTFIELLEKLQTWKFTHEWYDILNIRMRKPMFNPEYIAEVTWLPCEDMEQ